MIDHIAEPPVVMVVSMSRIVDDVRVLRHIEAIRSRFRILTIGYGPSPEGVQEHIEIPERLSYLPTSPKALIFNLLRRFDVSSESVAAIRFVRSKLNDLRFDVALINDVASLPIMRYLSVPVVVDMHEYAPLELEEDWRFRMLLMRYNFFLCSRYLRLATAVTTVSHGLAKRYQTEFGVSPAVILNARDYRSLQRHTSSSANFRLVHTGLAARARQLDVMIEAVAQVPTMTLDLYLVPARYQSRTIRKLRRLADSTTNVRVLPAVDSASLPEVINNYDLALIYVAHDSFTLRHGMPNKLFDSIQARVGIVCGPSDDIAEFCTSHQIGVSTSSFGVAELVHLLRRLDVATVDQLKVNCERVATAYHASIEGEKLCRIVEDAVSR